MVTNTFLIIVVFFIIAGVGALFDRVDADGLSLKSVLRRFWIGFAALIAFLQFWHFLFPVNWVALLLACLAGAGGWALTFSRQPGWLCEKRSLWLLLGGLALLGAPAFLLGNNALFQSPHVDYGLYHLQTVKWFSAYPLVPGLGNLHHRLAFNHAIFLFGALLNAGSSLGLGYYLTTNVPAYALILQGALGLIALIRARSVISKTEVFMALILPAVLWHFSHLPMVGYSADNLVFIIQVVVIAWLLELFDHKADLAAFQRQARRVLALSALGIALKLSFAFFALMVTLVVLALWWTRFRKQTVAPFKTMLGWAGLMLVWVAPWLARNVIMSGYLLYPSTFIALPVKWRMPGHLADGLTRIITLWARTDSDGIPYTGDLNWFITWAQRFPYIPRQALLIGVIVLLLVGVVYLLGRGRLRLAGDLLAVIGISLGAGVSWFISAPDYRFSGALLFILMVSAFMLALYLPGASSWSDNQRAAAFGLLLLLVFYLSPNNFSNNLSRGQFLLPASESALAEAAQPASGMKQETTLSGLMVYLPSDAESAECWDYPLPCTPQPDYFNKLSLIDPHDMAKGFFIPPDDGE
ncbi:MAG: hypothetical protein HPY76_09460 [Anaerolineae bacterium]|nr:hypothetical protein [Anaerolineae bacterium]